MTAILKVDTIQDTAGNNIINESSNTITIGKSGDAVNLASGATNNLGITMADQWRVTTDFSFGTSGADITSNLERIDTTGQGTLGTGMTESSGIFSFPQTGIYRVEANFNLLPGSATAWIYSIIKATTNNSSYTNLASSFNGHLSSYYVASYNSTLVDVTDTSNVKVKFHLDTDQGTVTLIGNSTLNNSYLTFTRLGDT